MSASKVVTTSSQAEIDVAQILILQPRGSLSKRGSNDEIRDHPVLER